MTASARRATAHPRVGKAIPIIPTPNRRWAYLVIAAIVVGGPGWLLTRPDSRIATELGFTGSPQTYVVPAGICRLRVDLVGGAGGQGGRTGTPGAGAEAAAEIVVKSGETLRVNVGGWGGEAVGSTPGAGGWNGGGDGGKALGNEDGPGKAGGGGGGATDIRSGGGLEHRILVAAGGAGGAGDGIAGPLGIGGGNGGLTGHDGAAPLGTANPATGGRGATQTTGGDPGRNSRDLIVAATAGVLGRGGDGAPGGASGGGGGGGGLYGGGGGGSSGAFSGGHGGGGSGFGPEGTAFRAGVGGGDGRARISYDLDRDGCAGR